MFCLTLFLAFMFLSSSLLVNLSLRVHSSFVTVNSPSFEWPKWMRNITALLICNIIHAALIRSCRIKIDHSTTHVSFDFFESSQFLLCSKSVTFRLECACLNLLLDRLCILFNQGFFKQPAVSFPQSHFEHQVFHLQFKSIKTQSHSQITNQKLFLLCKSTTNIRLSRH